jgi:hypothetical protein
MTAETLIAEFQALGVELIPNGDKIRYRPASVVPADLKEKLRQSKAEVLAVLTSPTTEPARPVPSAPSSSWPANLPNLGERRVIAFSPCSDCEVDPPTDELLKVGAYEIAVPGQRGTFAAYGSRPLCVRHTRARVGEQGRE